MRDIAEELGFDVAGTHRSLRRLGEAGLYSPGRRRILEAPAEEFLIHAVKFSFPAQRGSEVRGIPTAWAVDPLKAQLAESTGMPPVWPYSKGELRGFAFEPLHTIVPEAAQKDPELWERLALVDALRSYESARITGLAAQLLRERIRS